jgi:hypothetical protein
MAATYSSRLRALKQEYNTNPESWGGELNTGAIERMDEAWAVTEITVGSEVTLTSQNALADESRGFVLIASGDGGFAVITPAVDKPYLVINDCTADITMKPSGGTAATIRAGTKVLYYTNEAATVGYVVDPTLDKIKAPVASVSMGSQKITSLADGVDDNDAVNVSQTLGIVTAAQAAQTAAETAQGLAETAKAAAETAYDNFDDRYLGAKSSEPSVDNDGDALITGALFFDTVAGAMKVYDGAAWIALDVVVDYSDATFRISDDGDATKKIAFQASGITTGTTRTLTVPDASGTIALTSDILSPGLVLLSTQTVASPVAAVDFTSGIDGTYDEYEFRLYNIIPETDAVALYMRTSTDGGSTFDSTASDYDWGIIRQNVSSATINGDFGSSADVIELTGNTSTGSDTGEVGVSGYVRLFNPSAAQQCVIDYRILNITNNPFLNQNIGAAKRNAAANVDAVRFFFSSGNIESGTIRLYGIRKS